MRSVHDWTEITPDGIIALAQTETDNGYRRTREVFIERCQQAYLSEAVASRSPERSEVAAILSTLSFRMLEKSEAYIKAFGAEIESVYRERVRDTVEPEVAYKWRCVVLLWYKAAIIHDIEHVWLDWVENVLRFTLRIGFVRTATAVDDPEYIALGAHENEMQALRTKVFNEVLPIPDDVRTWIIQRHSQETFGYKEPRSELRTSKAPDRSEDEKLLANLALISDQAPLERLKLQFELLAACEKGLPGKQAPQNCKQGRRMGAVRKP